ncbi:MAG: HAMP domain-containing protein [Chloroflexi bacterium]|nr:HAMP domain-containing protein [Chloroflexota bacterium]
MKKIFNYFRRIQWKLTLSYAFVTASSVIVLAIFLVGLASFIEGQNNTRTFDSFFWSKTGFQDNLPYLLDDSEAMQKWLDRVHEQGFRWSDFETYRVRESLDYANTLKAGTNIYVLDPDLNVLAVAAEETIVEVGSPFNLAKISGYRLNDMLEAALSGDKNYYAQSIYQQDNGGYISAFPLRESDDQPVVAIVIYQLQPISFASPSNLYIYQAFFIVVTLIVLAISLPVGAIFGWLASRGLRKRLTSLSTASQAWSKGDFSPTPRDASGDEIGDLTRNLNAMADQLQILLQTRNELSRIEERNRLARDLHDTVKQQTYASRMQLTAAKNLLGKEPEQASEHLDTALQLNRETQQELKLIIDELRPAALEGKGLPQAMTEYAERWQEHTGINTSISISGERPLALDVEQVLYRILQESLSNVARHAEADEVALDLNMVAAEVQLSVTDNGRGFEPNAVSENSLGLKGMQQRIEEINGSLTVESVLIEGTKIIASVPLSEKEG